MSRPVDNLGITRPKSVDGAGDNSARMWILSYWHSFIHGCPELSTELSPVCPQGRTSDELLKQGLSTQSTALTTTTEDLS